MRLKKEFLIYKNDPDTVLVPTGKAGFSGVVRGNRTFRVILELLKDDISEQEMIKIVKNRFDGAPETIEKDVRTAINELRRIGALDE